MAVVLQIYAFVWGAVWGSFLNVVIYRLPLGASVAWPPSACGACGTRIRWFDNIPIVSYLVLRGRCRVCGAGYSPRYMLVEIIGGGQTRTQAYYANSLAVQLTENYGQLQVAQAGAKRRLSKVYVKVYAQMQDGSVRFYKDGYTDLRGRFDYTSLNTNELDNVRRFALLILSDHHGAVVREASPPKR